jgi:imidazolonepropionase-like amidohydrolase
MHRIDAELLVYGRGEPLPGGTVLLDGDRIAYAGPTSGAPPTPDAERHRVHTVMPGLWDCHVHLMGLMESDVSAILTLPMPLAAARCVGDLGRALDAGFTSVREVGGLGVQLARAVEEGTVRGPRIYAAGSLLSQTGGHGDVHRFPLGCVLDFAERGGYLQLCDGADACMRGVRLQLRQGARLIKICASGGVLSELDHPIHQQFSDAELAAIVAEAARAERIVAAHCHGKPGIVAALRAGARTIEHGTYLDEEVAGLMKDRGAVLVPTRFIVGRILEIGEKIGVPAWALAKMRAIEGQHRRALELAVSSGVTVALGTDIATTGDGTLCPWGMHGHELGLLCDAGMTPLQAIEAATANGPLTLGPQAPRSGVLAEGHDADVVCLDRSPLDDIRVLADPAHVVRVFQAGKLVKNGCTLPLGGR